VVTIFACFPGPTWPSVQYWIAIASSGERARQGEEEPASSGSTWTCPLATSMIAMNDASPPGRMNKIREPSGDHSRERPAEISPASSLGLPPAAGMTPIRPAKLIASAKMNAICEPSLLLDGYKPWARCHRCSYGSRLRLFDL